MAAETVYGEFNEVKCWSHRCEIRISTLSGAKSYPPSDAVRKFKALVGTRVEVAVERRQEPGEGHSSWPSGGCRWTEVAVSVTRRK